MFTTRLFLLLPFQWQGWRKISALPTALTQLTRRSGFWFLSLYSQVCSFPFLLHVWLQLSIKRYTKAASLTDLFNSLPSLSYVRLPTLLQRTCAEIKPFIIVSIWIIKNVAFFFYLFILLFSAESSGLQLSTPKLDIYSSLLWAKQIYLSWCLYTWNITETSQQFCTLCFQVWMNLQYDSTRGFWSGFLFTAFLWQEATTPLSM